MASTYGLTVFFGEEKRLVKRGEMAWKASHLNFFEYDGVSGRCVGKVHASMKDKEYLVELWCNEEGQITEASCSCPRGKSQCHHMAVVALHSIHNISSTSKMCSWKKPKGSKEQTPVQPPDTFKAITNMDDIFTSLKEEASQLHPCHLTWLLKPEPAKEEAIPFLDVVDCLAHCTVQLTADTKKAVEEATRGQRGNPRWSEARRGRLTASNFGRVIKKSGREPPPSLLKTLLGGYDASAASAIQWGINHEEEAIQELEKTCQVKVVPSGIFLDNSGTLGASPDGLIGEDETVEVKCPFSARAGLINKVDEGKFFLKRRSDGEVYLDATSDPGALYYHQIQGGLHLSGRAVCRLVVWAPGEMIVVEIPKDADWAPNLAVLRAFHRRHISPVVRNPSLLCALVRTE